MGKLLQRIEDHLWADFADPQGERDACGHGSISPTKNDKHARAKITINVKTYEHADVGGFNEWFRNINPGYAEITVTVKDSRFSSMAGECLDEPDKVYSGAIRLMNPKMDQFIKNIIKNPCAALQVFHKVALERGVSVQYFCGRYNDQPRPKIHGVKNNCFDQEGYVRAYQLENKAYAEEQGKNSVIGWAEGKCVRLGKKAVGPESGYTNCLWREPSEFADKCSGDWKTWKASGRPVISPETRMEPEGSMTPVVTVTGTTE